MFNHLFARGTKLAALLSLGLLLAAPLATAQTQEPSASAIAMAKEFVVLKGASRAFEPLIPGVIESAKNVLLQTNPMLSKDLNEVAARLHKEYAPRQEEVVNEIAILYARKFTEQELKELIAFYNSPLGKRLLNDEPAIIDASMNAAQNWANRFSEEVLAKIRAEMKKKGHDL